MTEGEEQQALYNTALQTIERMQMERQRAERELVAAREALQRRTEELEQQRERFEITLASIGDAVVTTDVNGHVTFLNSIAESMLGLTTEQARGQSLGSVVEIFNEDTRLPVDSPVTQALQTGQVVELADHTGLRTRDGKETAIEDSAAPIRDHSGAIIGAVMVFRDVTRRRAAERELQRSAQLLTDFFENAAVGLHWVGPDGIVLRVNQTELDLLGYTREEYVNHHISEFHADRPVIDDILTRLSCGECLQGYQARLLCKDGSIRHVLISSNVLWEDGKFIHTRCFTRDVSAQKQAEEALRETDRRKDEFLAVLAHELRNPLAPIRQAALISKSADATEAQKQWSHEVIGRQVHHMSLLLDDLLDVSRVTRGMLELRPEQTELARIVEAAVETARPLIDEKQHALVIEMPDSPVVFAADPLRLAQILSNLLTNAAKYTDPGGSIRLRALVDGAQVTMSVAENGIGMSAEGLSRVFVMFSQVKASVDRSEGGLGIGLALAKGLVELHGGEIEARSEGMGKGSEFVVRLPLRQIADERHPATTSPPAVMGSGRRILIADDNRDAAESLAILLELDGHKVTVAHSGPEALAKFLEVRPEVAVLDIGMPELDGYEVAQQIRQLSPVREVTLIAVTGWGQDTDKTRAHAAGFDHHFTKPIEPELLSELLREDSRTG